MDGHVIDIPQAVIDRAVMRRGTRHVFDRIDPARTALLVIDLQRAYVADATAVPSARGIVDNVNRLAQSLRKAGGRVVWIKDTRDENSPTARWPRFVEFCASEWGEELTRALSPDHPGHELFDGLAVDGSGPHARVRFIDARTCERETFDAGTSSAIQMG